MFHQRTATRQLENEADEVVATRLLVWKSAPKPADKSSEHMDYPLPLDDWRQMIVEATRRIRAGALNKVVLSRVCDVEFTDVIDPIRVIESLDTRYPDCYRFLMEVESGHAFFGATPELMAEVHDSNLHTMALAGSRKRGATP